MPYQHYNSTNDQLKGHNSIVVIWVKSFQNELMAEIYSKRLVGATGLARTPIRTHKGDGKWPLFVDKELFWWSALTKLDNDNYVLTDL